MIPAISVALCTRDGARWLPEQVASICAQQPAPAQLVVSDDASSDASVAAVRAAVAASPLAARLELTVLENPRPLGVARNFAQALAACRHPLVALSDQDDTWHPGKLARMAGEMTARPGVALLHTDARLVDERGRPLGSTLFEALQVQPIELAAIHAGSAFAVLLRRNLVTGATAMLRRELLAAALPIPGEWLHDEWLGAIAAALGTLDVIAEPWIDYRQHGGNAIGAAKPTLRSDLRRARQPRGAKHHQRMRRAAQLLDRLLALQREQPQRIGSAVIDAARGKLAHQRFRASLPAPRLARLVPVLREAARGGYHRFDRGMRSAAQDLLERGAAVSDAGGAA